MKALTIKQPWASLIVHGIKDIENRTWKTDYRGPLLIHASKTIYGGNLKGFLNKEQLDAVGEEYDEVVREQLTHVGAIIGRVDLVDCVVDHESVWAEHDDEIFNSLSPTFPHPKKRTVYNWVLANPVQFIKPIPCPGKLSLWDYDLIDRIDGDTRPVCTCSVRRDEGEQVIRLADRFECRFCGGEWHK